MGKAILSLTYLWSPWLTLQLISGSEPRFVLQLSFLFIVQILTLVFELRKGSYLAFGSYIFNGSMVHLIRPVAVILSFVLVSSSFLIVVLLSCSYNEWKLYYTWSCKCVEIKLGKDKTIFKGNVFDELFQWRVVGDRFELNP